MMVREFFSLTLSTAAAVAIGVFSPTVQQSGPNSPPPSVGVSVVEAWFDAMNALDGSDENIERVLSLYTVDAKHLTGPESHQRGTVTFDGHEALRYMTKELTELYENLNFRLERVTARETTAVLFHRTPGPWGDESVAVQFWVARTHRENGKRHSFPAAGFFQIVDGKIHVARIYRAAGETAEVEPLR